MIFQCRALVPLMLLARYAVFNPLILIYIRHNFSPVKGFGVCFWKFYQRATEVQQLVFKMFKSCKHWV